MLAVFAGFPRQVERIDGDAMSAEAGTGIEWHEAEGLRLGGVDDFPDVDAHRGINDLQLIDQGDVHAAEDIFEQLRRLGGTAGGNGNHGLDGPPVEGLRAFEAGGRQAADDLRNLSDLAVGIAGIFALRRKGEMEINTRLEAGTFLQHLQQVLVGRARIGGRFQHHEDAAMQIRRDGLAGDGDVGNIRLAVLVERRGHADDDGLDLLDAAEVGGGGEGSALHLLFDGGSLDMLDVAPAGVAVLDLGRIDVQAEDVHARAGELK